MPRAMSRVRIVGAGMAGLACGASLSAAGISVVLHEAAGHAGGRCRSFYDKALDRPIDNGNHLMLGANEAIFGYLDQVGARDTLIAQSRAAFPFVDLKSGERWVLRPSGGAVPWWIFSPSRRVPGSRWPDYLAMFRLGRARLEATVAECLGTEGPLYERLWKPLTDAVLNADPTEAAASLLWPVLRATFGKGEAACRAYVAREGLSPGLVEPGVAFIERHGGELRLGERLRGVERADGRAVALDFTTGRVALGAGDAAVLAVPHAVLADLLPEVAVPEGARAIVNAHYRLERPADLPEGARFLGLVGGTAQWLFARGEVVSVTVSAADALAEEPNETLARRLWADVAKALELGAAPLPPWRIVKEKRATFAQNPRNARRRPGPRVGLANLFLAGDWTDTGLPATIESAVISGRRAAVCTLESFGKTA